MRHKCFTDVEREIIVAVVNGAIVESIALMGVLLLLAWWYVLRNNPDSLIAAVLAGIFTIVVVWLGVREWKLRIKQ